MIIIDYHTDIYATYRGACETTQFNSILRVDQHQVLPGQFKQAMEKYKTQQKLTKDDCRALNEGLNKLAKHRINDPAFWTDDQPEEVVIIRRTSELRVGRYSGTRSVYHVESRPFPWGTLTSSLERSNIR